MMIKQLFNFSAGMLDLEDTAAEIALAQKRLKEMLDEES
jgi:hypothetical protein